MQHLIEVTVQVATMTLFTLLPILVGMSLFECALRLIGFLPRLERLLAWPVSFTGLPIEGVVAITQVAFVSFAAPLETLRRVGSDRTSHRTKAAVLAAVLTMAQANATFPLMVDGLSFWVVPISILGALVASTATYYWFCARPELTPAWSRPPVARHGLIDAGKSGARSAVRAVPYLFLGLILTRLLDGIGASGWLCTALAPILRLMNLPEEVALALATKFLAGGTAMLAITHEFVAQGVITSTDLNRMAGVISPLDLVGAPMLMAAVSTDRSVIAPSLLGAVAGLLTRSGVHLLVF